MRRRLASMRDTAASGVRRFFLGDVRHQAFFDRRDWTLILGLISLAVGLGQVYPPAAAIAVGAILVAAALGFSFTKGGA